MSPVPGVWVVASHRMLQNQSGHVQRYTVMDEGGQLTLLNMGLQPVCFPRVPPERIESLLGTVDGILLGGSDTNVHPRLYGEAPHPDNTLFDEERDALVQPLIRLALQHRVPIISFCRGSHDFNVAMGGNLHQCLKEQPQGLKHWEDPQEDIDEQYHERHFVTCTAGGELERITGMDRFAVSSLHQQGTKDLGRGLVAEARADDGLLEAFRWHDASLFAWGFQFHPEWNWRVHPGYNRIMQAYVQAVRRRFGERTGAPSPAPQTLLPLPTA